MVALATPRSWCRIRLNTLSWLALAVLIGLQWLTVSAPPLAGLLGTTPLGPADWLILAVGVLWPVTLLELGTILGRARPAAAAPSQ